MAEFPDNSSRVLQSGDELVGFNGTVDYRFPFETLLDNYDTDNVGEGATNLYYTGARFNTAFAAKDTGDLAEDGTNFFVKRSQLSIAHAGILTLNSAPPIILEVPAGNNWVTIMTPVAFFDANGVAYTNSGVDIVDRDSGVVVFSFPSTLLNSTSDKTSVATAASGGVLVTKGGSYAVKAASADPTNGTAGSFLKVVIDYVTVNFDAIA